MINVLFVCHGNICRSTMAEFVFKDMVRKAGLEDRFFIDSAATSREEIGNDTDPRTKRKLDKEGIPYTSRRAHQIKADDAQRYDYMIGMDDANIRNIKRMTGASAKECCICKLLEFAGSTRDISDPWYTGDFDLTYDDVAEGCSAMLSELAEKIKEQETDRDEDDR